MLNHSSKLQLLVTRFQNKHKLCASFYVYIDKSLLLCVSTVIFLVGAHRIFNLRLFSQSFLFRLCAILYRIANVMTEECQSFCVYSVREKHLSRNVKMKEIPLVSVRFTALRFSAEFVIFVAIAQNSWVFSFFLLLCWILFNCLKSTRYSELNKKRWQTAKNYHTKKSLTLYGARCIWWRRYVWAKEAWFTWESEANISMFIMQLKHLIWLHF